MQFWKRKRRLFQQGATPSDAGQVRKARRTIKRSPPVAMEVKLLAIEAVDSGLSANEVGELVGVSVATIHKWHKDYAEGGVQGLCRKASSIAVRSQCSVLEEKIVALRRENPDYGVRRIRDELRRHEGIEVSAEKVRTVVNDAELGNAPPEPHRRGVSPRRFERSCPNAMWQMDIFTFHLKRMYPVYLIGIIDDHSRYLVGWGLFRQQNADAVLEVLKGAIGQWGAPREILSDNGRQFVAWRGQSRFQKVLRQQGVQHVRSAPQHPMTLGKIERFWQTVWREFLEEAVFSSFADACQRLEHWIHYYNHQRPHQGIDGGCPADRFYGIADDVQEAVKQGCRENALRLALGQEAEPPLYLLGQVGSTDVRVVRKGEEIEVKVGDAVHEVIRMGAPFRIEEDGSWKELSGQERYRVVEMARQGELAVSEVCRTFGVSRQTLHRAMKAADRASAEALEPKSRGRKPRIASEIRASECEPSRPAKGAGALEDEVPGDANAPGSGAEAGAGGGVAWREGGKKAAHDRQGSGGPSLSWVGGEAGPEW
jgi:transposase InsO family protein